MTRKTALVVCPGRGSYQAAELGVLHRYHSDKHEFLTNLDDLRQQHDQTPITALDQAKRFTLSRHTNGENASLLIYACALGDFMDINREQYEIVAVAGNSMGWYLSLACAGALSLKNGAHLVNTMGTLMHQKGVGGQIIYPLVDDNWKPDAKKIKLVEKIVADAASEGLGVYKSIQLGGMVVFAADDKGMDYLKNALPAYDRYPMALSYHAAFHSPLLDHIIPEAQSLLPPNLLSQPQIPMIDGRGHIWSPQACDLSALYTYTLGAQINETYDFSRSIEVGLKEFAPECVIVLGPGTTMGAPVAQCAIAHQWSGLRNKETFKKKQAKTPFILSMGMDEQRQLVI